jgi:hypothetical protein
MAQTSTAQPPQAAEEERPARRSSKPAGSAAHELYLFFTISLPNFVLLRTRTSALRENFTFSLHFLYHFRELRLQPSLRDLEVVGAIPPNTQVLGYSRMSLRDKGLARFQICKSHWHWRRTFALREKFTFSLHFLYRNRV